jgi:hypothetical protein
MNRIIFTFCLLFLTLNSCTYYLGPNQWENSFPEETFVIPRLVSDKSLDRKEKLSLIEGELQNYAKRDIHEWNAKFKDTILNTRYLFAQLLLQKDIAYLNQEILKHQAWGTTGTSGFTNKKGDYDFSQIQWVNILFYFKDAPEILYPNSAQHIIDALIIDKGSRPTLKAPHTLGLLRETENHILMKEISRYLQNQWLFEKYGLEKNDNSKNGMQDFLISHLQNMLKTGFFEFNANPYISYTFEALHVLHSCANNNMILELSAAVISAEHWQYALGSYQLKKYSPFRRRMSRSNITSLYGDRHNVLIRAELAKANQTILAEKDLSCCFDRTLTTVLSNYQLPNQIKAMIEEKPVKYFAKIGHGLKSSPEIYYGTTDYLLSAGGLRYGKKSQIVPRPSTLLLNDESKDISECFHVASEKKLNQWNNTGVYRQLMVSPEPIYIPKTYHEIAKKEDWQIFKPYNDKALYICVLNIKGLGILYLGDQNYEKVLNQNNDKASLQKRFIAADHKTIEYQLHSKKKWIISSIDGQKQQRKFKKWSRFDVSFD